MNEQQASVDVQSVTFRYADRVALDAVDLTVRRGEIFGLLGPNGGGKTTLFRLLTTYFPLQQGVIRIGGHDVTSEPTKVRQNIGVVFQHPSLDGKLTVAENLRHHARLYGIHRSEAPSRIDQSLAKVGLTDRKQEIVEKLSGGLARRAELAKGMLHRPELLILDEPSTGLDPGARRDLWQHLRDLQAEGVTSLLTTHLMEEAERCDRLAILDRGKIVGAGAPDELRALIGGEIITVQTKTPDEVSRKLQAHGLETTVVENTVRCQSSQPYAVIPQIAERVGAEIDSLTVSKPTLEDVFIRLTGHRFWTET